MTCSLHTYLKNQNNLRFGKISFLFLFSCRENSTTLSHVKHLHMLLSMEFNDLRGITIIMFFKFLHTTCFFILNWSLASVYCQGVTLFYMRSMSFFISNHAQIHFTVVLKRKERFLLLFFIRWTTIKHNVFCHIFEISCLVGGYFLLPFCFSGRKRKRKKEKYLISDYQRIKTKTIYPLLIRKQIYSSSFFRIREMIK